MSSHNNTNKNPYIPRTRIAVMSRPILDFLAIESAGGFILLFCTVIALVLANSPFAESFDHFWHTNIAFTIGENTLSHSLAHWINDGLMAIFFFVVGLEIKRELVSGELKDPKAAALPAIAALGGMIAPAIIYTLALGDNPGKSGWGIPMATDIAFVVGFLSLLGNRVPHGLKIFLLSLAIIDDLGAVLVIAIFYSSDLSFSALMLGALGLMTILFLNKIGVRRILVYVLVGFLVWLAFLFSGVHSTIAGVILGLLTPSNAWIGDQSLKEVISNTFDRLKAKFSREEFNSSINEMIFVSREAISPLDRLVHDLHPWVAFFIMPLFALANAGVTIEMSAISSTLSHAVTYGLLFGKPIGIVLFSWLAIKIFKAKLPTGVNWPTMIGAGCLGGIGFTMSIFIANLALDSNLLDDGKVGTLIGSSLSAIIGLAILYFALPKANAQKS
ncbi:MAG: Na+/H+ antiporter NhaA [Oligoflexales bacterium]|nr:Na+/H+ antiporter NhaA [Oligoflexales bacterium]